MKCTKGLNRFFSISIILVKLNYKNKPNSSMGSSQSFGHWRHNGLIAFGLDKNTQKERKKKKESKSK